MNSATKREALFIFLLLAFLYAYFYQDGAWNGNSRLGLTFAIVEEGRLTIDSFHDQDVTFTEDKAIFNGHPKTTPSNNTLVSMRKYRLWICYLYLP